MVRSSLKKRVVVGHCPVFDVSRDRRVGELLDRYRPWSVILRHAVGPVGYGVQVLIYPVAVALAAAACAPGAVTLGALGVITLVKVLIDGAAMHILRGDHPSVRLVAAVPMKGCPPRPGLAPRAHSPDRGVAGTPPPCPSGHPPGRGGARLCRFAAAGAGRPTRLSSGGIGSGRQRVHAGPPPRRST